jgi:putative stabilisation protein
MGETEDELIIVWTSKAELQYLEILLFWMNKTFSRSYSDKIEKEVEKVSNLLKRSPRIGKCVFDSEIETEELREVIILHNFSIFYKLIEEHKEIRFIAFWDNRNDPDKLDLDDDF